MNPDLLARQQELREDLEKSRVQFLLTELDTAMTFCGVAKASTDPEKTKRNIGNAWKGYDTALRLARNAHLDQRTKNEFDDKVARVRSMLRELGQDV